MLLLTFSPFYSAMHTLTLGLGAVAIAGILLILALPPED